MISSESIAHYQGTYLSRGRTFLFIPPHTLLRPYIANYTISFPTAQTMPDDYTILPTASSTLVISVSAESIISVLRGVNTKACNVGARANKMKLLLLIEFHPGGLYPFMQIPQYELVDSPFALDELNKALTQALEHELIKSENIDTLIEALDQILIARVMDNCSSKGVSAIIRGILKWHGSTGVRELSAQFGYSEKQICRLFLSHVGTSPKMFSRIVRANYALKLLQKQPVLLTDVSVQAGFFDQPHFIHDFKMICGLTPQEYVRKMSVFYNDQFKM